MKLWAVHFADYGDDGVVAIFDSKEKAEAHLERQRKRSKTYSFFIESYILNFDPIDGTIVNTGD